MCFEEYSEILKSEDIKNTGKQLSDELIGTLCGDPVSYKNLVVSVAKMPINIRDILFLNRFQNFLKGVYLSREDAIRLSDKLFNNEKTRNLNATRIIETIAKIDSDEKNVFLINTTRCLLCGCMDNVLYFRIIQAIADTLYEDLIYLSQHAQEECIKIANPNVLGLAKSGLMISDGVDGNLDAEYQSFVFTILGMQVVQYAIDVDDDVKCRLLQQIVEKKKYDRFGRKIIP